MTNRDRILALLLVVSTAVVAGLADQWSEGRTRNPGEVVTANMWVALAAVFSVAVTQWSVALSVFKAFDETVSGRSGGDPQAVQRVRDGLVTVVGKMADAGWLATVIMLVSIVLHLIEKGMGPVKDQDVLNLGLPLSGYLAALQLGLLVLAIQLLLAQFGAMKYLAELFSVLSDEQRKQHTAEKTRPPSD